MCVTENNNLTNPNLSMATVNAVRRNFIPEEGRQGSNQKSVHRHVHTVHQLHLLITSMCYSSSVSEILTEGELETQQEVPCGKTLFHIRSLLFSILRLQIYKKINCKLLLWQQKTDFVISESYTCFKLE